MPKWLILIALFVPLASNAATITYDRITTYSNGTPIPSEKVPTIQYRGYSGPNSANPDVLAGTVTDNQAITAPDPDPGGTLWYTVDGTLDGATSGKAAAVSKTVPFLQPAVPKVRAVD